MNARWLPYTRRDEGFQDIALLPSDIQPLGRMKEIAPRSQARKILINGER